MDDVTAAHELLKQIEKNERINCSRSVMPIIQAFLRTFALQQRAVAYRDAAAIVRRLELDYGSCAEGEDDRATPRYLVVESHLRRARFKLEQQARQGEGR